MQKDIMANFAGRYTIRSRRHKYLLVLIVIVCLFVPFSLAEAYIYDDSSLWVSAFSSILALTCLTSFLLSIRKFKYAQISNGGIHFYPINIEIPASQISEIKKTKNFLGADGFLVTSLEGNNFFYFPFLYGFRGRIWFPVVRRDQ